MHTSISSSTSIVSLYLVTTTKHDIVLPQDAVVARVRLWQDAPSWSEELVKALALEAALVQPALALTRKVHDAVLTDKVMVLANILALARDAAAVAAVLAKATDAEKPCSLENVALLSTLRKHIGMMKYCVGEGELSRFNEETRLALPFRWQSSSRMPLRMPAPLPPP